MREKKDVYEAIADDDLAWLEAHGAAALQGLNSRDHQASPDQPPLFVALTWSAATSVDDPSTVNALIALGAEVGQESDAVANLRTPLAQAALQGLERVASALLDAGADLGWATPQTSVLHAAAQGGVLSLVQKAMAVHPIERLAGGTTPLCDAAYGRRTEVVKFLLEAGADPNFAATSGEWEGYDVLAFGVERGADAVVELLLRAGVDWDVTHVDRLLDAIESEAALAGDCLQLLAFGRPRIPMWYPDDPYVRIAGMLREHMGDALSAYAEAHLVDWAGTLAYEAARRGDVEGVGFWLDRLDDDSAANRSDLHGMLRSAAASGHHKVVRLLLERGWDPNEYDHDFGTPLIAASALGDVEIVQLLLEAGAKPDLASAPEGQHYPETPLSVAAAGDHLDVVQALLAVGANPNKVEPDPRLLAISMGEDPDEFEAAFAEDEQGFDPVEIFGVGVLPTCCTSSPAVIDVLVEAGADLTLSSWGYDADDSYTVIDHAVNMKWWDAARRLRELGLEATDSLLEMQLSCALSLGDVDDAEQLIDLGAKLTDAPPVALGDDLKKRLREANSLHEPGPARDLTEAIEQRDLEAVRRFVADGASLDRLDEDVTPLDVAVEAGATPIAMWLIEQGASWTRDRYYMAPHRAATWGLVEVVRAFLDHGLDIEVTNDRGETMLYVAAYWGREEVVRFLIERGAAIDCEDANGHSPIRNAYWGWLCNGSTLERCLASMRVLLEHGANTCGLVAQMADHGANRAHLDLLAEFDRLDTSENGIWGTPLHNAVCSAHHDTLANLLELGADPNAPRRGDLLQQPNTPLHMAAARNDVRAVELLLEAGANPQARDASGEVPFDVTKNPKIRRLLAAKPA